MNTAEITQNVDIDLLDRAKTLEQYLGNTPLFPIDKLNRNSAVSVYAKLEWQQFGDSVKARPAYRIIFDAIQNGHLNRDTTLLDASSGNTGIAYAQIAAKLGIPVTLCLPENASEERKQILRALGVDLRLTSRAGGTDEAQEVAESIFESRPDRYFYADQYSNPSNWKAHYDTTGPEIWEQTNGAITHFIAGLGTTGTFTGTGRRLKEFDPCINLIALQPDIALHGLEGWKHLETAHTPGIYDGDLPDEIRSANTEKSYEFIKQAALHEGLLISPSSAANLAAALHLAEQLDEGTIVTVFPDDGSKYSEILNQIF